MAVDLLRRRLHGDDEQMLLQVLASGAQRAAGIVNQLLTFGRGLEPLRGRLRPKTLLREVAKIVQETFPKSIRLETDFASDLRDLMGDPTQLHQVLLNLCINARDAMPQGGLLTLTARNVQLEKTAAGPDGEQHSGPHVVLEVTDSGTGMTPEVMNQIFVPFFTTKPVGQGTGLGLATVRDIAQNHGGFVQVWSQVGKGTRFSVYFPAAELRAIENTREPLAAPPSGHGELILVADDEQSVLKLAKHTLESHGYRVLTAADGQELLAIYSRNQAEVRAVVIDLMMPNLSGEETIASLTARNPSLPVIAISGLPPRTAADRPADSKPMLVVSKPFTIGQLLEALHTALADRSDARAAAPAPLSADLS
jgi:CheY-like chemotaxis protein